MNEILDLNVDIAEFWKNFNIDDNGNISFLNNKIEKFNLLTYTLLQQFKNEKLIQEAIKDNYDNFIKEGKFALRICKFLYKDIDYSKLDCQIYGIESEKYKCILNHVTIETVINNLAQEAIFDNDYMRFEQDCYGCKTILQPISIISKHLNDLNIFDFRIVFESVDYTEGKCDTITSVFDKYKNYKATLEFNTGILDTKYQEENCWTMRKEVFELHDFGKYFNRKIYWGSQQLDLFRTSYCNDLDSNEK